MQESLEDIAQALVAGGKGILAADESNATIKKRFDTLGIVCTEDSRRAYREMLFTSSDAMKRYISGVILYDETLRQKASDGRSMSEVIGSFGAYAGIKVDRGLSPLAGFAGEMITEGLDGLRARLQEYYQLGARFAKWRAALAIDAYYLPSRCAVEQNAYALARYAALCQEVGLVPIVEPEILMDGTPGDHSIDRCYEVSEAVLRTTFAALFTARVKLEAMILKPNMVIDGKKKRQASAREVAEKTAHVLKRTVPAAVAGVAFLSGGQDDVEATEHLALMQEMGPFPWPLTFSYGRALQAAALKIWAGEDMNMDAAQQAFCQRARMNALAASGQWTPAAEQED